MTIRKLVGHRKTKDGISDFILMSLGIASENVFTLQCQSIILFKDYIYCEYFQQSENSIKVYFKPQQKLQEEILTMKYLYF